MARSLLEPMGEPQGGTTKTLFWRQALLSPVEPDERPAQTAAMPVVLAGLAAVAG